MTFNVAQEVRNFRIWQVLHAEDFRCSIKYVAEQTGIPVQAVAKVCHAKGWASAHKTDLSRDAWSQIQSGRFDQNIPVDKLMLDYDDYSRLECLSIEES